MATFAELDQNNVVINIVKVSDSDCGGGNFPESEPIGIEYLNNLFGPGRIWKQCSVNRNFRKNKPAVGCTYDPVLDIFYPFKQEWETDFILDEYKTAWIPPVPRPSDNTQVYKYNLVTKAWEPVPKPYPSWVPFGKLAIYWTAPVPYPQDGKKYNWDEATLSWIEVVQ